MPYQPRATLDNPYGPQVAFRTLDVLPPAAYYVGLDDQFVFHVYTDYAPVTFTFVARLLRPEGVITVERYELANVAAGPQQLTGNLSGVEGYVLSLSAAAPNVPLGAAYITVTLMRAPYLTSGLTTALLMAGYASDKFVLSYPTTTPRGPVEGPGHLMTVTTTAAAGAEWVIGVPLYARWQALISWSVLTASSAGTARQVNFVVLDRNSANVGVLPAPATQQPGTQMTYGINPGGAAVATTDAQSIGASAPLVFDAGGKLSSFTLNLQPGDQWSNVALQVQEWVGV